ncbi:MAG: hypothetical protein IM572_00445 [Chitinophagaceae bacterium]|nr:hypothetical protein [Chitinophagaceae bacterium]MCA6488670.1 hypothetical protein [Chitinophagaceae bacterium]MCA6491113.1 hypothetical protein [Chitinophagaceae bacterium]MCA6512643.1 hypothetical protein [Chitinophagaceae bacterium]
MLFNLANRWRLHEAKNKNFILDSVAKGGIGPVIPHVGNSIFVIKNDGFQLGAWNMGVETGLKATFLQYVFIEMTNKVDDALYSGLKVCQETVSQAFGNYELILSL